LDLPAQKIEEILSNYEGIKDNRVLNKRIAEELNQEEFNPKTFKARIKTTVDKMLYELKDVDNDVYRNFCEQAKDAQNGAYHALNNYFQKKINNF
jgi:hypothetical protein